MESKLSDCARIGFRPDRHKVRAAGPGQIRHASRLAMEAAFYTAARVGRVATISATEPMIFVEPESCYDARLRMPRPLPSILAAKPTTPQKPIAPGPLPSDDFWTERVFDTLQNNDNVPMRITSVVNVVVDKGGYTNNAERVERKIKLFKLVGRLIRIGRLDRCDRKFVVIPTSDARRRAFLAKAATTVEPLPPCL